MKHTKLLSIFSLVLLLTACGPTNNPTTVPSTEDPTSTPTTVDPTTSQVETSNPTSETPTTVISPETSDWKEEAVAIMKEYLDGNVLPYYSFDNYVIYYDADYMCVSIETSNTDEETVHSYASVLENNGYEKYSTYEEDFYYDHVLAVNDFYYIEVMTYLSEDGYVCVDAYSIQYYASWPEAQIKPFCDEWDITENVPSYDSGYLYELNESYTSIGILVIYCYTSEFDPVTTYMNTLEAAGVTIEYSDEYGTFYGPSQLGTYQIEFFYEEEYSSLTIYLYQGIAE